MLTTTTTKIDIDKLIELEIPPLPSSIARVIELTQTENHSARQIAEAIGADPALAAKVLRIANSPIFFLAREIVNLLMAVNTLGNEAIKTLLITSFTSDSFRKILRKSPQANKLWVHSVAAGLAARELSHELGMRSKDEAFVCGLLHDLGKLALLCYDPMFYQQLDDQGDEFGIQRCEIRRFGYSHSQVGALMTQRWGLPNAIVSAIYYHHQPGEAGEFVFMSRIVDIADQLANVAGYGLVRMSEEIDISLSESAMCLKLQKAQLDAVWDRTTKSLETMIEKLG